jgi:hypothetical protein
MTAQDGRDKTRVDAALDARLDRLEAAIKELKAASETNLKRTSALQAQFDHFSAKIRGV